MADKLWCDLKTDEDKAKFLRSGEANKTGIIAIALQDEVAEAFEFRASHPDVCPHCQTSLSAPGYYTVKQ